MEIRDIFLNSNVYKLINSDLNAGMLNHCYLLSTNDDVLREAYPFYIAKLLFCLDKSKPCDKCINCEKINHSNMVDIKVFPEDKDKSLVVEDIAKIVSDCYIRPIDSIYKIYILNNFDDCTIQGQNKILKTLEEPPQNVVFILTCSNINNVLPTILSRSKKIETVPLEKLVVEEYLLDMKVNNSDIISGIAQGNLSHALKLIKNNNIVEIIKLVYDILLNLRSSADILKFSSRVIALKKDIEFFVETFMTIIRDILVYRNKGEVVFKSYKEYYETLSKIYSGKMIDIISEKLCEIKGKLEFNCNIVGVIDKFLLDLLEVKYLWQK